MKAFSKIKGLGSCLLSLLLIAASCNASKSARDIVKNTIDSIDQIESIYFKQITTRTNPQSGLDTITRFREMYFERLIEDSIVGVKGHWYMYVDDTINIIFEDLYDGTRVIRKNNRDSVARIYDLDKYPEFRGQHFWGHNTPYSMQYELKYMLSNIDEYTLSRLSDTVISGNSCYQVQWKLEGKSSMPGFLTKLERYDGWNSATTLIIDKATFYPCRLISKGYMIDRPEHVMLFDQTYFDIVFDIDIDPNLHFNTSLESLKGYEIREIQPE